jgi:hypothetical protein
LMLSRIIKWAVKLNWKTFNVQGAQGYFGYKQLGIDYPLFIYFQSKHEQKQKDTKSFVAQKPCPCKIRTWKTFNKHPTKPAFNME